MNKIFNTTFESSLRILLLLSVSEDEQMTLDRIADYDFITIYSKYFGISDMALHGENEFGLSEFAARRGMMQSTLEHFKGQNEQKIMKTISNTSTEFLRR